MVRPDGPLAVESGKRLVTAAPTTDAQARATAMFVSAELDLYPAEFIRRVRLARVVLCTGLALNGEQAGGLADAKAQTVYLNVASMLANPEYARQAIHHELFHIVDAQLQGSARRDPAWEALNPPEFEYTDEQIGADHPAGRSARVLGFISEYARTALEEDKAEVFGFLMSDPRMVARRATKDRILAAKVARMKTLLAGFCADIDRTFWDRVGQTRAWSTEARMGLEMVEPTASRD